MLANAKKGGLEQFYNNMDRERIVYEEEPAQFTGYTAFKDYVKQLKTDKKNKEGAANSHISNPFQSPPSAEPFPSPEPQSQPTFNFRKKSGSEKQAAFP
jgi:hypothetical protein